MYVYMCVRGRVRASLCVCVRAHVRVFMYNFIHSYRLVTLAAHGAVSARSAASVAMREAHLPSTVVWMASSRALPPNAA